MTTRFIVKKTPTPPELILDYDSEISFDNTTEDFPEKEPAGGFGNSSAANSGSILVGWVENMFSGEGGSTAYYNLKNIDLIGSDNFSYQATLSTQVATKDIKVAKITGYNRAAVAYSEDTGGGEDEELTFRIQTVTLTGTPGSPINGPITKTAAGATTVGGGGTLVLPLSGGDLVWVFKETGEENGTFFSKFDYALDTLLSNKEIDAGLQVHSLDGVVLDNGNVAFVYTNQIDDSNRGLGVFVKVFDISDGSLIHSDSTSAIRCLENGLSIVATDDGGFIVCISDDQNDGSGGEGAFNEDYPGLITLVKYDSTGNYENEVVIDFPATDPGGGVAWGSILNCRIFKLDSGDIGVVGYNYNTKKLFAYVINQSLTTVQQPLTLLNKTVSAITNIYCYTTSVAKFSAGKYGYVAKRQGASGDRVYVDVLVGGEA